MNLRISRALLDQIMTHAGEAPDEEVCGLLFGSMAAIERAVRARNVAPDPRRAFEIDPVPLLAAHRAQRFGGPKIIGHYHSHPSGDALPSVHDAANAIPDAIWLIIGSGGAAAFMSRQGGQIHGRFDALELVIE